MVSSALEFMATLFPPRRRRSPAQFSPLPRQKRRRGDTTTRRRVLIVWGVLMVAALLLLGRLAHLQVLEGSDLHSIASQQQARPQRPAIARRPIVDSNGMLLAADRIVYTLYGHPMLFQQPIGVIASTLSPLLDVPPEQLATQLKQQPSGVRLLDGISEETARRVRQLRLNGLELIPEQQRFYPQQDLFSQVVGFVNLDGEAQTGLEVAFKNRLSLPHSAVARSFGSATIPIAELITNQADPLQLTVDGRLQRVAQEALRKTLREHGAKRGTVMVMEVNSGAIHALAVEPTFDPNRYFDANLDWLKNWALTDLYEPGSTLKPINIAIALDAGAIDPDDTVYDDGRITIGPWTIQNSDYEATGRQGTLTITDVLKYSSNIGMVRIMNQMPATEFYAWLEKLGIDEPTAIDLPAENVAPLKDREQFVNSTVEVATTAFGQGIAMTPIKLLQLQAAIANGGKLVTPHVVQGVVDDDGTLKWQPLRPAPRQVFSPEAANAVLKMMEAVVETGTGKAAQIPGYRVAGKTGTAQKVTEAGVYGNGRITSFVGVVPVEAPRFVVLAVIDEPSGDNAYGSTVSAPLVKTVMESLVVLEGIPPSSAQALGSGVILPQVAPAGGGPN